MSAAPRRRMQTAALGAAVATLIMVAGTSTGAVAGSMDPPRLMYRCTVAATDLGDTIRVVFRLNTDGAHQPWHVRMWDDGRRFFVKQVVTGAGGDLRVKGVAADHRGRDHLRVSARRLGAGPTCRVTLKP